MPALRRLAGLTLLAGAYLPLHRLLVPERAGPAGAATRAAAESAWTLGLSGSLIVLACAWVGTRMLPERAPRTTIWARLEQVALAPGRAPFAVGVGVLAAVTTALVAVVVHGGAPTSVDEMAQLLNARALATGRATVPLMGSEAAWTIQNGLAVPGGWISIYPPLHTLLLAVGWLAGGAWLVGPAATGVATACVTWTADRLCGPRVGRLAGLLLIVSPFWLLLGATQLSHTTAVAGLSLAMAALVRARDGGMGWQAAAGAALGVAVSARPWIGVAAGAALVGSSWLSDPDRDRRGWGSWAALVVGGLPFAVLLLWWNQAHFGHPLRLGYSAAFGDMHGLGLHVDPWGNRYGVREALAYTGADLTQLGVRLFESPLPAVAIVGAGLLLGGARRGTALFGAWLTASIAANALYWHHGIHFGPRMLYEAVPALTVLFASVAVGALESGGSRRSGHGVARWSIGIAVIAGLALTPGIFANLIRTGPASVALPALPTADPSVVFVHGSWASRLSARLAAAGMRRDSIETALRRNDICTVDRYTRDRERTPSASATALELTPLPGSPNHLQTRTLSPGNLVRVDPSLVPDATCRREAQADRLGILDLELLAWRLPPLGEVPVVVARDLGPAGNLGVLQAMERTPWIYLDRGDGSGPILLEYDEGMELLWGGAAREGGGG